MRSKEIIKRLERELRTHGCSDFCIDKVTEVYISASFSADENTDAGYTVKMIWIADDDGKDSYILFRAWRAESELRDEDETACLRFCNMWNNCLLGGTAVYSRKDRTFYLDRIIPLPKRISGSFLSSQIYGNPVKGAEGFFADAQKQFKWQAKNAEPDN